MNSKNVYYNIRDDTTVSSINGIREVSNDRPLYTDLCGRRVVKPSKGICIRSTGMADGNIKSAKTVVHSMWL